MEKKENAFKLSLRAALAVLMMFFAVSLSAQNITVKGSVVDQVGEPIVGATVKVLGSAMGVITDVDGNYTISCPSNATLEFTYIGYASKAVDVRGKQSINVVMEESSASVDEVVVTALGIKKDAKKVGYSISSIGSADIVKTGAPNLASGLYGKAAGVRINSAPGGGLGAVSFQIRGLSSITRSSQPLLVLDGVPIRFGDTNNDGYWDNQRINSNGLVDINPEDIENISILKGAAASALYGSEAANGVVMITTKKGTGKGTHVELSAGLSFDVVAYMPEIQKQYGPGYDNWALGDTPESASGFRQSRVDRNGNSIVTPVRETYYSYGAKYDASKSVTYFDGTVRPFTPIGGNLWDEVFRTGVNQNYNVSVSNATERNTLRFSYTYNNNLPTQYNSNNNKHNFNLNGTFEVFPALKINYSATYEVQHIKNRPYRISRIVQNYSGMFGSFTDVKYIREHTMTSLGYMNSVYAGNGGTAETLTPDEQFLYTPMGSTSLMSEYFWNVLGKEQLENHNRFIGSVNPVWTIIPGLTLSGRIATDLTTDKIENKNRAENAHIFSTNGQYSDSYGLTNSHYKIIYGDVMLSWDKTFSDIHNITVNAGYNARREDYWLSSVSTSQGLTQENWFHINASVGQKNSNMTQQRLLKTGLYLTASYGFDNWAYLEGTIRQEKTSTMHHGTNTFYYPSISLSALYTEFMKDKRPAWWDYGKIRIAYGVVGNSPGIYSAYNGFSQGSLTRDMNYTYNYVPTTIGNENIRPERKHEFEVGLENKFFHNRLGFELSYYNNTVKDQILTATAAASMGGRSMLMNVGELSNNGIEFSVYGAPIMNKDWRWDLRFNIAKNNNKVNKLADGLDLFTHATFDNGAATFESHVGEPIGDIYAYTWKTDDKGNYLVGSNGLYITDTEARHKVGNAMPDAIGGFGTSLSWKNFTLDLNFDFRIGGDVLNQPWQYYMDTGIIEDAVGVRDASTGGLFYYSTANDMSNKSSIVRVDPSQVPNYKRGETKIDGHLVWDNGLIQRGVKEDGTPNDIIVTQFEVNDNQYGWGTGASQSYRDAVQKNSYVKCREISLAYTLPTALTKKFHCDRLTVSAYARNPFYLYRSLKLFDAETSDGTYWVYQAQVGGSTASARTFGISLRASF
ncbi:SusC/RagA family TonB-linked outer membrane protein [Prevotella sp. KH2C16]|uniref:SusC/RagA family TonB-linked outer membrane protein n=1 Tax=Prevotella sp. KH2C16 TaxID=1855325 RepID=UPI0008EEF7B6|nr:TonB-linked outer membrane protein, SusC/RagA family [Prevotella sp. KH2C16]